MTRTRSRQSARRAGSKWEKAVAAYMAYRLDDDRIEQRVKYGKKDRGDITGVRFNGRRVVLECKNRKEMNERGALREAETERGNDDADFGVAVLKFEGIGMEFETMGQHEVVMTLDTFLAFLAGGPDLLVDLEEEAGE